MTEDIASAFRFPYDFSTDPDRVTLADVRTHDIYLDALLDMVLGPIGVHDDNDRWLSLTVTAGGVTVSGRAIGPDTWAKKMESEVAKVHPGVAEGFTSLHENVSKLFDEMRRRREEENRPQTARRFLHMSDVTIFANTGAPLQLPLWRGQMCEVSSWTLGTLSFD
ncbi:hypothetical protein LJ753_10955 [Arthrobacter sp. zg-Y20]|uniref:hypothetical protein n=1 Tax=unclassified Arthrobacter TaxID=235627 RepID=UPI001D15CF74|nr:MULTISPECIES: hypothetical protein [unclassified Arthrobacter]MCC3276388.1 hypothetical protein [Arthrobacter sp. zg-Y20]MDK1316547.1 hypothetical protein [Arthrobacter sp. zg.Y20]WIB06587.1 hypothetical protein QNO06_02255 [Arthrobacter sp. zg-Y20]